MSAGIDIGNRNCIIAVTQRGGVDIVVNEANFRQTPCMVAFSDKERDIGEAANTKYVRNIQNTISEMKRLIGRKFTEPEVQEEIKNFPFKVKSLAHNEIGVEVMYKGQRQTFSITEITGQLLRRLRTIAVKGINNPGLRDVVISVPVYYTSQQRQALLDATRIGGWNCLRLINETTATALAYGFYKTDLPEKDPVNVMFVDLGDSSLTVSVVSFVKDKLKVLSHSFDRNLGGRDFDRVLFDHFCKEFQTKYHLDIRSNTRARIRLQIACERMKKMLSANSEVPLSVECIMNDVDVKGMIKRTQFEELVKPLLERIALPIKRALEESGLTREQISSVELVGGGTRIPAVGQVVTDVMGKPFSRTLNAEESTAKGCALQSAFLSPLKKARDYKIEEWNVYPINLNWHDLDASPSEEPTEIFPRGAVLPGIKMITFPRGKPFVIEGNYSPNAVLPDGTERFLGKWTVPEVPEPSENAVEKAKVKVKVRLNLHGVFGIEYAQMIETLPGDAPVTATPASPNTTEKMETDEKKEGEAASPAATTPAATPAASAPKVVRKDLKIEVLAPGIPDSALNDLIQEEDKRVKDDQEIIDTAELKNTFESYIVETKSALWDDLNDFVTDEDRKSFIATLEAAREWLYGEGETGTKDSFKKKLEELKKIGDPIELRKKESYGRDDAVKAFASAIEHYRNEANSTDPKYEHIPPEERNKILNKITELEGTINPKIETQSKNAKHKPPVILNSELYRAKESLESFARPILNKPKPAPKKEEPKKEEAKPDDSKTAPPEAKNAEEAKTAEEAKYAEQNKESTGGSADTDGKGPSNMEM